MAHRILSLQREGESDQKFAERIGLGENNRAAISNWRNEVNGASLEALAGAVHGARANPYFLLFGEGAPVMVEPGKAEEALARIMDVARAVLMPGAAGENAAPDQTTPAAASEEPAPLEPETAIAEADASAAAADKARRSQPKPREERKPRKRKGRGGGGGR